MKNIKLVAACMLSITLLGCGATTGGGAQQTTELPTEEQDVPLPETTKEDKPLPLPSDDNVVASDSKSSQEEPVTKAVDPASLTAGTVLSQEEIDATGGEDAFFWAEEIPDDVFARMEGKSFGPDCTVPRESLRYLKVLHVDAEGTIKVGEMVVNASVADEVVDIFHQLYDAKWPIKKMYLIDDYDANDDASCADGNTAAFNYRMAVNAPVLSNHSYGLAIDINTYENPYYIPSSGYVFPPEAAPYLDRTLNEPYMIHPGDLCYQLFTERGWDWGGSWSNIRDYQHFEKV